VEKPAFHLESRDVKRRDDGQLDGLCVRVVVQADAAVICQRCQAAFARLCAFHILEVGWSARDQLCTRCVVVPYLNQGSKAEFHVGDLVLDHS